MWFMKSVSSSILCFVVVVWMTFLLVIMWCWSHPLSVSEGQYGIWAVAVIYDLLFPCVWCIDIKNCNVFLVDIFFNEYIITFPAFSDRFGLKSDFSNIKMVTQACFLGTFAWIIFCPEVISIFDVKVCCLDAAEGWVLFLHSFC